MHSLHLRPPVSFTLLSTNIGRKKAQKTQKVVNLSFSYHIIFWRRNADQHSRYLNSSIADIEQKKTMNLAPIKWFSLDSAVFLTMRPVLFASTRDTW